VSSGTSGPGHGALPPMLNPSRNCFLYVAICLGLLFSLDNALAQYVFPDKPSAGRFYVDAGSMLTDGDAITVNNVTSQLLSERAIPLIIVTVPSLASYGATGNEIEQYARALFDRWGIGSPDRNYGILMLVSRGDRKARIELGHSWSSTYNAQSAEIMNSIMVPEFRNGNYSAGIAAGVKALDAMVRGRTLPKNVGRFPYELLGIGALFIGVVVSLIKDGTNGWGWKVLTVLGAIIVSMLLMGLLGGKKGAFGGGFSGGRGATGSW
jgi:uncharacterized protein